MEEFRLNGNAILGSLVLFLMVISCTNQERDTGITGDSFSHKAGTIASFDMAGLIPYDLGAPSAKHILPGGLAEISGISYYKPDIIACIQDEKGFIYLYDVKSKKIASTCKFGNSGDYEDIAVVGDTAYVLRSDGVIFEVIGFINSERSINKISTSLSGRNDTEGLAFDSVTQTLLIVCKGSPDIRSGNHDDGSKAVYRFDLSGKKVSAIPLFRIDLAGFPDKKETNWFKKQSVGLGKALKLLEEDWNFQPSGIAIHPVVNDIYIISHIGKLLLVLDQKGKILSVNQLDTKIFRQPEGICFSPEGDLFISNEGDGGRGNILKFKYIH
jgi:uncharacterized protein YjiK